MEECKGCLCLTCEREYKTKIRECEFNDCKDCEKYGAVKITRCRKYIEKGAKNEKCRQNNKKI